MKGNTLSWQRGCNAVVLSGLLGLTGCNAFTGADQLTVRDESVLSTAYTHSLADGLHIHKIELLQGTSKLLMDEGRDVNTPIPIVGGRDAVMRIHYTSDEGYDGEPVTVQVRVGDQVPQTVTSYAEPASSDYDLSTTFNVLLPGAVIEGQSEYSVELLQPNENTSGNNSKARYPVSGSAPFASSPGGAPMKVVLVPIVYKADGSNRLPETSVAQVQLYRDMLYKLYPVPSVQVTVAPAYHWEQPLSGNGDGWGELLDSMVAYRAANAASNLDYFYGIFMPTAELDVYCSGSCLLGLSYLTQPSDVQARVGIGVGYPGLQSVETAAHELGHLLGRYHAPCGANADTDELYPYEGGVIGSWGYDLITHALISPYDRYDLMSYCGPAWVSDYTFTQMFRRIKEVEVSPKMTGIEPRRYPRLRIEPDGTARVVEPLMLRTGPIGRPVDVSLRSAMPTAESAGAAVGDATSQRTVKAYYSPYSHIEGGSLLLPPDVDPNSVLQVTPRLGTF